MPNQNPHYASPVFDAPPTYGEARQAELEEERRNRELLERQQLEEQLVQAKTVIENLESILDSFTSAPMKPGVVFQINLDQTEANDPTRPFQVQDWIRVNPDSPRSAEFVGRGQIERSVGTDLWLVQFPDGGQQTFESNDLIHDDPVRGRAMVLFQDGGVQEVALPPHFELTIGDCVSVHPTGPIVAKMDYRLQGVNTSVKEIREDGRILVEIDGKEILVRAGSIEGIRKGDTILVVGGTLITENLGQGTTQYQLEGETGITWSDVAGQQRAVEALKEAIELPFEHPGLYQSYGLKPPKGVLVYGPPGCGKTLLGKAAATQLRMIHGGEPVPTAFQYVKGPELLEKWVGNSEQNIRRLFDTARGHYEQHGYPGIIFIDEAEALLSKRGTGVSSDMDKTIVPTFLSEMDGLDEANVLVMLATNRAETLDPAVVRDGRVDRKVQIARPDREASEELFRLYLGKSKLHPAFVNGMDAFLPEILEDLFSESRVLYLIQKKQGDPVPFLLGHVVSGAMIKGIIDRSVTHALKSDIAAGVTTGRGVRPSHVLEAIQEVFVEQQGVDHKWDIEDFTHEWKHEVAGVERLRTAAA